MTVAKLLAILKGLDTNAEVLISYNKDHCLNVDHVLLTTKKSPKVPKGTVLLAYKELADHYKEEHKVKEVSTQGE